MRRAVYYQYEQSASELVGKTVDMLLSDWSKIVYLYSIVHEFTEEYNASKLALTKPLKESFLTFDIISSQTITTFRI